MTRLRPDSSTASPTDWGVRLLPPLAAVLAMASLAGFQADPRTAAETAYLALAAGIVLTAAAAMTRGAGEGRGSRRPATEAVVGSLLVTAAVWTLPGGPARGAVALALAVATLTVATLRRLPVWTARTGTGSQGLPAVPCVALAVGLQALLRGGELLAFGAGSAPGGDAGWSSALRGLLLFGVFPAVGAAAVLVLARLCGRRRALLVAAAVLLMGPGFRPATLSALVALAAAPALLIPESLGASGPGGAVVGRLRDRIERRLGDRATTVTRGAVRLAALALLAAPFAWDARAAAAALVAGLAWGWSATGARPGRTRSLPWVWAPAALAAAGLALALAAPGRGPEEAAALAALVPLALPALVLPERQRAPLALAALLLAVAAARGVLVEGPLAAPAALAALAIPRRGAVAAVQGAWSGALVVAASLVAAYPWLRPVPLPEALGLFGLPPGLAAALAAVAGLAALAGLGLLLGRTGWAGAAGPAALRTAVVALAGLAVLQVPAAGTTPLDTRALVLDGDRPSWTGAVVTRSAVSDRPPVRTLVLDSSLANGADLPAGTPVATLRLRDPGRPDRVWTVRAGDETGEWAADRPDLRARRLTAPDPWLSWVAEGGAFFGRRYRSALRLGEAAAPDRLELRLRPDLPPEVALSVFHLELRP